MLPQIMCQEHNKEIIIINLDPRSQSKQRAYCQGCLNEFQNVQPCKFQVNSDMIQTIKQEYDFPIDKIKRIKKLFITLQDNLIQIIDQLITESDQYLNKLQEQMENEIKYYRNLMNGISRIKLEEIASLLSSQQMRESQKNVVKEKLTQFELNVAQFYKFIIEECQDSLKKQNDIYKELYFLGSYSEYSGECTVLDTNLQKQMIVGTVGKNLMVWNYDEFKIYPSKIDTQGQ